MTFRAFLDASVLAKPFTRTILLVGSSVVSSTYVPLWSDTVEADAQRALVRRFAGSAEPLADLRNRWSFELTDVGRVGNRFQHTSASDRQVLADAEQARALILVTEDVDDFDDSELARLPIAALHFDDIAARYLTRVPQNSAVLGMFSVVWVDRVAGQKVLDLVIWDEVA